MISMRNVHNLNQNWKKKKFEHTVYPVNLFNLVKLVKVMFMFFKMLYDVSILPDWFRKSIRLLIPCMLLDDRSKS